MKILEAGDICKITEGVLAGTLVELFYYDPVVGAWRVAYEGGLMWYKTSALQFMGESKS